MTFLVRVLAELFDLLLSRDIALGIWDWTIWSCYYWKGNLTGVLGFQTSESSFIPTPLCPTCLSSRPAPPTHPTSLSGQGWEGGGCQPQLWALCKSAVCRPFSLGAEVQSGCYVAQGEIFSCHLGSWQMLYKYQASLEVQLMESQILWKGKDHMAVCSDSLPSAQTWDCLSGMRMRQADPLTAGQHFRKSFFWAEICLLQLPHFGLVVPLRVTEIRSDFSSLRGQSFSYLASQRVRRNWE